ncbi:MAG: hypothetical protein ABJO01_16010 [Parasphingorhabdus sp.]|uniref:hypothetical protein n=1 Tax=Parasphingorhabdus sp. TaxID=2709688 RepID=UPI00329860D6
MDSKLSLFIWAQLPPDFYLSQLEGWTDAESRIARSPSQFDHRDHMEMIFNGLTFSLFHFDAEDMAQTAAQYATNPYEQNLSRSSLSAIGIMPADHIASGKHSETINNYLLQLARYVGLEIDAKFILWQPSQQTMAFSQFLGVTNHQGQNDPISIPLQMALIEQSDGTIHTNGLRYFCEQEIRFKPSFGFAPEALRKRAVHIAQKIAASGKISERKKTDGLFEGELVMLTPDNKSQWVDAAIVADDPRQLH